MGIFNTTMRAQLPRVDVPTQAEVTTEIATALADYDTSAEVDTKLEDYSTTSQMNTAISAEGAKAVKSVSVAIADPAATNSSTLLIPANARIVRVTKRLTEVFDGTPTLTVGWAESLNAIADTSDTDLTSLTTQILTIDKAWHTVARVLKCVVGGSPTQGAGVITVHYIETAQA